MPCYHVPVRLSLALSLALAAACARGPDRVHVTAVRVAGGALDGPVREAGIDAAVLDAAARDALAAAGFAFGDGGRPHRAEVGVVAVRIAPPASPSAGPRVELSVELALVPAGPKGGMEVREVGTDAAAFAGGAVEGAWRTALRGASRRAAEGLALAFAAEAKPLDRVIADLDSKDPRVRDHAVRILADRRSADAVPALIRRLRDDEPRIVHRAIGALAQIRDERAVGPLIELSRSGDPALAARVARLIGDIGGAEAEGYLLTVEAGHPDGRVRKAAREALGEMQARAEQSGALSAKMRRP